MTSLTKKLSLGLAAIALTIGGAVYAQGTIDPQGRPDHTKAGAPEHYALWHSKDGWHLRTMTKEHEHHFKGHIEVKGGEIEEVKPVKLEHNDHWKAEGTKITFDFSTKGGEDGIDWKVKGGKETMLEFSLHIGEKDPTFVADRIHIGKENAHPASDPFELPAHPGGGEGGKHKK
jgi:hypothetical protein